MNAWCRLVLVYGSLVFGLRGPGLMALETKAALLNVTDPRFGMSDLSIQSTKDDSRPAITFKIWIKMLKEN